MYDCYIGAIFLWSVDYAPENFMFCNGQELSIQQYQAVYALLGTRYGGNGTTTFALPNLPVVKDTDGRGESRYIICVQGLWPPRP